MKVVIIDPWGVGGTADYTNGLVYGIAQFAEVILFTNYYFEQKIEMNSNVKVHRVFFRKSQNMKSGRMRSLIRGFEYYWSYRKIIRFIKNHTVDVVHINWLLQYSLDIKFLEQIKKLNKKIIYTAHNVLPHQNGERYISEFSVIYGLCDKIILHGSSVRNEFEYYFPEYLNKTYIQKHGRNLNSDTSFDENLIDQILANKISSFNRVVLFFGKIFYNKGTDRLLKIWDNAWSDSLLIIAGKTDGEYKELYDYNEKIKRANNIVFINEKVDDNLLHFLISKATIIVLPYRHASMSGVVFTVADFSKPILCTDVGALSEYLSNGEDSIVVDNEDDKIKEGLYKVLYELSDEQLTLMGNKLHKNIYNDCSWVKIASDLIRHCYCTGGDIL